MRYFIPASDDELYAFIERYGFEALVPYRVGLRLPPAEPVPSPPPRLPEFERRAA